jgi:hypothetical protein
MLMVLMMLTTLVLVLVLVRAGALEQARRSGRTRLILILRLMSKQCAFKLLGI